MRCSFSITPSVVEAREFGSWSGQKPQKMDFQNIRGVEKLTGVRLGWPMRGSARPTPASGCKVPGSRTVCVRGWAEGVVTRIGLARDKSNHFQHNPVPTRSCLLDCRGLAVAGRRIPPCKATADLPPLLLRVRLQNCSKWHSIHKM